MSKLFKFSSPLFLVPSLSLSPFLSVSFLISFCLLFYWFWFSGFSWVIHNCSTLSTSWTWNHGRACLSGSRAQVARYWKISQKACKVHRGDGLHLSFGSALTSLCFFWSCIGNDIDEADPVLRFTSSGSWDLEANLLWCQPRRGHSEALGRKLCYGIWSFPIGTFWQQRSRGGILPGSGICPTDMLLF